MSEQYLGKFPFPGTTCCTPAQQVGPKAEIKSSSGLKASQGLSWQSRQAHASNAGSNPGLETKILRAAWRDQQQQLSSGGNFPTHAPVERGAMGRGVQEDRQGRHYLERLEVEL